MDWRDVAVLAFFGVAAVVLWIYIYREFWRDEGGGRYAMSGRPWTGYSRPVRRGAYRAKAVLALFATMVTPGFALMLIDDHLNPEPGPTPISFVAIPLVFGGILLWCILTATIIYFNRPRFLVPPHLRHHVGYARVLLRAQRIRAARRVVDPPTGAP